MSVMVSLRIPAWAVSRLAHISLRGLESEGREAERERSSEAKEHMERENIVTEGGREGKEKLKRARWEKNSAEKGPESCRSRGDKGGEC